MSTLTIFPFAKECDVLSLMHSECDAFHIRGCWHTHAIEFDSRVVWGCIPELCVVRRSRYLAGSMCDVNPKKSGGCIRAF